MKTKSSTAAGKKTTKVANNNEDAILPMTNDYMQQIVRREKTYEFRRYQISSSVKRIWFYLNAPHSSVMYICEIDPARTRNSGDEPLPEDGLGNHEFNTRHKDWDRYDYAYRVNSVRELATPLTLQVMKERYGMKGAPRSLVYVPPKVVKDVPLDEQSLVWRLSETETGPCDGENEIVAEGALALGKRKQEQTEEDSTLPVKREKR